MALPETPAGSEAGFTASERPEDGGTAGGSCDRRYVPSHAGRTGGTETNPAFH